MADGKVSVPGADPLAGLAQLAQTLMGSKSTTTTSPGDIAALQAAISQLQGADYTKLLQSIFQQAQGAIPGIQRGLTSTIGARSGNNSAVSAAMQKLLQDTTVAAQKQIADQMLQNQQTQVQAGSAIANATRGTSQTTNKPGAFGPAGSLLGQGLTGYAGLQALAKMLGKEKVSDLVPNLSSVMAAPISTAEATPGSAQFVGPMLTSPAASFTPTGASSADWGALLYDLPAGSVAPADTSLPSFGGFTDQQITDMAMEVPPIDYGADLNYEDWQQWFQ